MNESKIAVEVYLLKQLNEMGGFKFVVTLKITFEKNVGEKKDIKTAYFNSLPEIVLNRCDINLDFPIENILNKINRWISEGSAWTIHFIDNHYVNIIKYNPLKGNLYIHHITKRTQSKGTD